MFIIFHSAMPELIDIATQMADDDSKKHHREITCWIQEIHDGLLSAPITVRPPDIY